ncbi:hypothetical protein MRX96_055335 [Rhipicephalus microplus]
MAPASPHLGIQALVDAMNCMQGRLMRRISVTTAFRFPCSVQRRTLTKLSYYHRPGRERLFSCTVGDVIEKTADVRGGQFGDRVHSPVHQEDAGLVLVNVNTTYQIHELEHCLNHTDCKVVIVSEQFSKQDYYTLLLKLAPELASSRFGHLKSARLPSLKHVITIGETAKPGTVRFADLMESVTNEHLRALRCTSSKLQMDDAVNLQFTSGTTGKPKAAQLSHFNVVNNAYLVGRRLELHKQEEVICLNVPLIHCFGCIAGTISAAIFRVHGCDAGAELQRSCCVEVHCSGKVHFPLRNPDHVHRHATSRGARLLRCFLHSNSCRVWRTMSKPLDKRHHEKAQRETHPRFWITSVGRPLDHVEVKIVDDKNRIVPTNERGELCVRGYTVFMGYFKEDKKTKEAIRNGWYHTGDGAMMTEDGRVSILGRMRDVIVRGDEHVYPQEVEHFLYTHPAVQEVQVVGVPDEGQREEVCAWIKLKPGFSLSQEDIKKFCKRKMSHYKIPRYVLFVSEFPKTVSGKVQKHVMKEESQKILHL